MKRSNIHIDKTKGIVTMPIKQFMAMQQALEEAEDAADVAAYDRAKALGEEGFPIALWDAIWAGESPVRAFRNHRGLTQAQLAEKAQVERVQLSNIENGKAQGSVTTLKRIATALNVPLDALVPDEPVATLPKDKSPVKVTAKKQIKVTTAPAQKPQAGKITIKKIGIKLPASKGRKVAKTKK